MVYLVKFMYMSCFRQFVAIRLFKIYNCMKVSNVGKYRKEDITTLLPL